MTENTRKAVLILKRRLDVYRDTVAGLRELKETLKQNSSGRGVGDITHKLENRLMELGKLQKEQTALLHTAGSTDLVAIIAQEPPGHERTAIEKLLMAVDKAEKLLKEERHITDELLNSNMDFVLFQLNVISQTSAESIYSPQSQGSKEIQREIKMFDADV